MSRCECVVDEWHAGDADIAGALHMPWARFSLSTLLNRVLRSVAVHNQVMGTGGCINL
jgi:hypothetical protein